jgi:transcriptional regulator
LEARLAPKPVWKLDKVAPGRVKKLKQAITGIEMRVETVEGSFKLNQHKSDADQAAVVRALAGRSDEAARAIALQMIAMRPDLPYEPGNPAA